MNKDCSGRILIIDDNQGIHEDFRRLLSPKDDGSAYGELSAGLFGDSAEKGTLANFEIDSAFQGREGVEMARQALAAGKPYAVAFVDVRMPPGWDGIETTARLWEACPDLQVVICTAYSDYSWDQMARRLGQNDGLLILKKPFDMVEVLQIAATLARKWTLARHAKWKLADLDEQVNQRTQELRKSNEQLAREIADRRQAQSLLSAFSTLGLLLSTAQTVREAGQIIVDTADRLLGYDACVLDLYTPDTGILTRVIHEDLINGRRTECVGDCVDRLPSPLMRRTLQEGGQLVLKHDPTRMLPEGQPFGDSSRPSAAIMFVPIHNGTIVTGILSIQSYKRNAYDLRSLETLQVLADHCGGALNRIRTEGTLHSTQVELRQSQKLEAIGQLAGGIAHDFNNLLAVIGGNADMGRMDAVGFSGDLTGYFDQISAATERAAKLIRQLLAFSRKQMMRSQPVDLDDVIRNLTEMLERIIGEDIALCCHHSSRLPPVKADIGMLEQVLVNLVVNARDAMPGGGQLQITTEQVTFDAGPDPIHPEARPGDFVRMIVTDTGTGISPAHLPHIFEPFFTTKEIGKGTGLGLATAYGIVKQHQGWIEVSSPVGGGTTFRIYFPSFGCARASSKQEKSEIEPSTHGTETVQQVEDHQAVPLIAPTLLKHSGCHVLEPG